MRKRQSSKLSRRDLLRYIGTLALSSQVDTAFGQGTSPTLLKQNKIPSSGEHINPIGMGTWQTFNVGRDTVLRERCAEVLHTFFQMGGQLIDSSPMYGSSQDVLGYALNKLNYPKSAFYADKIWTDDGHETIAQASSNASKWGVKQFSLLQVHDLLSWQQHLEHLHEMKLQKQVRYIGVTTSHGRRHAELEKLLRSENIDFVQLTYNLRDREAEQRLLPIALEKGIAVIINRPFQGGRLIDKLKRKAAPLPTWAADYQIHNWAQFCLKFIVSHPAVTCAIPATSRLAHMRENMGAANGTFPTGKLRNEMISYVQSL